MGLFEEIKKNQRLTVILCITILVTFTRIFFSMISSTDLAFLPLFWGLAIAFFWFGTDNILDTKTYTNVAHTVLEKFHLHKQTKHMNFTAIAVFQGLIEVACAISFLSGLFVHIFSLIAAIILLGVIIAYEDSLGKLLMRDIGLLGATVTIFLLSSPK